MQLEKPISEKNIIRVLFLLLLVVALLAGYFHALYQSELRQNAVLRGNTQIDIMQYDQSK